jgi:Rab5 GDP/GTP exchange factor
MQAEIDLAHEKAAAAARETLVQIFPGMDKEVVRCWRRTTVIWVRV